ncbi:hypothetical protein J4208_04165 [Candidatus Woesearchaeota archaeon]|nr:hypothetical protein [Candidatus Woesearchaeota archaeon]
MKLPEESTLAKLDVVLAGLNIALGVEMLVESTSLNSDPNYIAEIAEIPREIMPLGIYRHEASQYIGASIIGIGVLALGALYRFSRKN